MHWDHGSVSVFNENGRQKDGVVHDALFVRARPETQNERLELVSAQDVTGLAVHCTLACPRKSSW